MEKSHKEDIRVSEIESQYTHKKNKIRDTQNEPKKNHEKSSKNNKQPKRESNERDGKTKIKAMKVSESKH